MPVVVIVIIGFAIPCAVIALFAIEQTRLMDGAKDVIIDSLKEKIDRDKQELQRLNAIVMQHKSNIANIAAQCASDKQILQLSIDALKNQLAANISHRNWQSTSGGSNGEAVL